MNDHADSKPKFSHIVITGGSSGIGAALALLYAAPGVRLGLTGRDAARLSETAQKCRARGAQVFEQIIDVSDREAMTSWLRQVDDERPIDLLIANAGISAGMGGLGDKGAAGENPAQIRRIFDVNVGGVFNTIEPLLPRMAARMGGHIAIISSLAGFRGWPGAPAYAASKAAVRVYGEGLRGAAARSGVRIHVICPGFIKTRMTADNRFFMPFLITAERAARIIARGIDKNRGRIAFPFPMYFLIWLAAALPDALTQKIVSKMPSKRAGGDL